MNKQVSQTQTEKTPLTAYRYEGPFKRAIEVASFYGFHFLGPVHVERKCKEKSTQYGCNEHSVALLEWYHNNEIYRSLSPGIFAYVRKLGNSGASELRLEILGNRESSAEALLIRVASAILHEYGHKNIEVHINSVGGPESVSSFVRETTKHYRTHLHELETHCREAFKKDPFAPVRCSNPKCQEHKKEAPQSLSYLSEQSRVHFKQVIEYLETLELPYAINNSLVGNANYTTRTLFTIRPTANADQEIMHADGERYDVLSKKIGIKKTLPAIGVSIILPGKTTKESQTPLKRERRPEREAYLIQVGFTAKLRAIAIAEQLRQSRVKIRTAIHHDTMGDQLDAAKKVNAPVLVIIGHKESVDGTAIVRKVDTHTQEIVPLNRLAIHIKRIIR